MKSADAGDSLKILGRTLAASESVVAAGLDDETVLLNVETGIYFGLDAIGTQIWKAIETGAREGEIVDRLLDEYEVDPAQLRSDVIQFIDLLITKDLARVVDAQ